MLGSTSNWVSSHPECGAISYSIRYSNDSADDSGIFSYVGNDVRVSTSSDYKIGNYQMKVVGSVGSYKSSQVLFSVEVINGCSINPFNTYPVQNVTYYF